MSVGANIRRIREKKGLTQVYVADQAGISQVMLSKIENGYKDPSIRTGKRIANILGCKLDDLVKEAITE